MPSGAQGEAYEVLSILGSRVFAGPVDRASVSPQQTLTFNGVSATAGAANLAFCVLGESGMPIWRSGPVDATMDNQFFILNPTDLEAAAGHPLQFPPAAFASLAPTLPLISGSTTVRSISGVAPGNGTISLAGTGVSTEFLGMAMAIKFTYVFSLQPSVQHPDASLLLDVQTTKLDVQSDNGTWFGWLINPVVNLLLDAFRPASGPVQANIQDLINSAMQSAVAAKSPVLGTTGAVQQVSVDPTNGIMVQAWAGVPLGSMCCGTVCSGSVKVRPVEQIAHLRAIRDNLLVKSPEGFAYACFIRDNNRQIMGLLVDHADLLAATDAVVARVLEDFTAEAPERGVLSSPSAATVTDLLDRFAAVAPAGLALSITGLKREVAKFVGVAAGPVLHASWSLLGGMASEVPAKPSAPVAQVHLPFRPSVPGTGPTL